jgi:hypothetical protein
MYNMIKKDKREIEKIEKTHLRSIFHAKTGIQIPIHLMYLDGGRVPARYQIAKYRMNFFDYILQQKKTALLYSLHRAQEENPTKGTGFLKHRKISKSLKSISTTLK